MRPNDARYYSVVALMALVSVFPIFLINFLVWTNGFRSPSVAVALMLSFLLIILTSVIGIWGLVKSAQERHTPQKPPNNNDL